MKTKTYEQYKQYKKPTWAPPSWIFGPVWTVLYILIAISFGDVIYQFTLGTIGFIVLLPFILNLIFNALFTPIQFGLRNNALASVDILLVLLTLGWAMVSIFSYISWVTYINIPYFIWVCFATVLQVTVTYMNRR